MLSPYTTRAHTYDSYWARYTQKTVEIVLPELKKMCYPASILDYGCGTGEVLFRFMHSVTAKRIPTMVGYDPSKEMLAQAREKVEILAPEVQEKIKLTTSIPKETLFKCIVCTNVLHYFKKPEKELTYFYSRLEPKGTLLLLDYSKDSILPKRFERMIRLFDPHHIRAYLPHEAKVMVEDASFEIVKEETVQLDTWWKGFFFVARKR